MTLSARSPVIQTASADQSGSRGNPRKGRRISANPPNPAPKTGKARRLAGEKLNFWVVTV
jgi:hypothetical protein